MTVTKMHSSLKLLQKYHDTMLDSPIPITLETDQLTTRVSVYTDSTDTPPYVAEQPPQQQKTATTAKTTTATKATTTTAAATATTGICTLII